MADFLSNRTLSCARALVVGCALSTALVGVAHAQASKDVVQESARALADEGANAYAAHDYERALSLFQRAHMLVPAPTIVLFEARTLVRLGRLLDARSAYLRLLRTEQPHDAPAPFRNALETGRAELAQLEQRIPRLHVVVAADARSAPRVLLDDRPLPAELLRGPLLVDPGAHSLELRTNRGNGELTRFVAAEGEAAHVQLTPPAEAAPDPRRTWAFVAIGAGAAGLALGVTAGAVALSAHDEAEQSCPQNRCAEGSSGADAVERFRDWRTVSTIGYVVGAVSLGAGVTLFLTSQRDAGTQLAVLPTLGGARLVTTW